MIAKENVIKHYKAMQAAAAMSRIRSLSPLVTWTLCSLSRMTLGTMSCPG